MKSAPLFRGKAYPIQAFEPEGALPNGEALAQKSTLLVSIAGTSPPIRRPMRGLELWPCNSWSPTQVEPWPHIIQQYQI